jgi:hypothetical protein
MDIEVRPLIVEDVFIVARMLSKVTKGARAELSTALSAKEKPDPTELGIALFQSMFIDVEEDLKAWLADIIGKSKEDLIAMPATTMIDIIEALTRQESAKGFFGRVSQLVAKVGSPD